MAAPLHVELRPHVERGGYHSDRFDAYLAGQLICTSRQPWHDCARKLIELGHPPDILLIVQHHGRAFDPTIKPRSIGDLAKWTYEESDRGGIRKVRWRPREFGGSGSTLIACEKAGRQARLIELDPKYVDTIILRWQEFSGGAAVLDGDSSVMLARRPSARSPRTPGRPLAQARSAAVCTGITRCGWRRRRA